jgi:hypothetical protein
VKGVAADLNRRRLKFIMKTRLDTEGNLLSSPAPNSARARNCLLIFSLVFSFSTAFAIFTNHAWEDYYITYRCSKNLAAGQGLVYTQGERVHAFTSPLGVLIPALLCKVSGNASDELVLWLFRILSAAALATAACLLALVARSLALSWIPAAFLIGMFALDVKTVDFSINGMETGILMLFLGLLLNALIAPGRFPALQLGISIGGLMWTRPDSFVYIGGLVVGFLLFNDKSLLAANRRGLIKVFVKACLIAALLYLPWIVWAWHYYGSPIPHTVVAKGLSKQWAPTDLFTNLLLYPVLSVFYKGAFAAAFLPPYAIGEWPYWLTFWSRALAWSSAIAWIFPRLKGPFRAISFSLMVGGYYLDVINPFPYPWYLPVCTLFSIFVLSGILKQWTDWNWRFISMRAAPTPLQSNSKLIPKGFVILALTISLVLTVSAAWQLRVQQKVIEEGNRKQIGLWLARNAASKSDTVFLEPLGYIGFFSQLKMLDYPGLCSPEIVAARKKLGSDKAAGLIREVKPIWIVFRTAEVQRIRKSDPELFARMYDPVKIFDVSQTVRSYGWLPGRGYLQVDQAYTVFRRRK